MNYITEIYEDMISKIPAPNHESKIWSKSHNKLSVCLIDVNTRISTYIILIVFKT